jgi:hypothetical protein
MDQFFTGQFWHEQWAVVMSAPWLIVPLLLLSGFIGWRFRKAVDDGEIRGLREQKLAAADRLQLAHDRYGPVVAEVGALKDKIVEQTIAISDLKNHPHFQKAADEQLAMLIRGRLDALYNSNNAMSTTVTNLSTSTTNLGKSLTIQDISPLDRTISSIKPSV